MLLHWVLGLDKHFRYPHTLHKLNFCLYLFVKALLGKGG